MCRWDAYFWSPTGHPMYMYAHIQYLYTYPENLKHILWGVPNQGVHGFSVLGGGGGGCECTPVLRKAHLTFPQWKLHIRSRVDS